jgi:hypothetical protein
MEALAGAAIATAQSSGTFSAGGETDVIACQPDCLAP